MAAMQPEMNWHLTRGHVALEVGNTARKLALGRAIVCPLMDRDQSLRLGVRFRLLPVVTHLCVFSMRVHIFLIRHRHHCHSLQRIVHVDRLSALSIPSVGHEVGEVAPRRQDVPTPGSFRVDIPSTDGRVLALGDALVAGKLQLTAALACVQHHRFARWGRLLPQLPLVTGGALEHVVADRVNEIRNWSLARIQGRAYTMTWDPHHVVALRTLIIDEHFAFVLCKSLLQGELVSLHHRRAPKGNVAVLCTWTRDMDVAFAAGGMFDEHRAVA